MRDPCTTTKISYTIVMTDITTDLLLSLSTTAMQSRKV